MERLPEHDQVEVAVRRAPVLERANLDGYSLFLRDSCHSRIRLNRKDIGPFVEELSGSDPGTGANIEHPLSAPRDEVSDQLVGVARPTRIIESRGGTKRVRARPVNVQICVWLHAKSLRRCNTLLRNSIGTSRISRLAGTTR
jgi:hypothetical protein